MKTGRYKIYLKKITQCFQIDDADMNFHSLDILRGLAALWVVSFHTVPRAGYLYGSVPFFDLLYDLFREGGRGVYVFFIISGYCISVSAYKHIQSPINFIKRRAIRIYPPYWASIIIGAFIVTLITMSGFGNNASWPDLNKIAISLPLLARNKIAFNGVYWSLVHEVHFYLFTFLGLCLFKRYFIYIFDLLLIKILLNLFLQVVFFPQDIFSTLLITKTTIWLFYYGVLIFRIFKHIHKWIVLYDLGCLCLWFYFAPWDYFIKIVAFFMIITKLFDRKIIEFKILRPWFALGHISYSLYLTHILIGPRIMGFADRLFGLTNVTMWIVFFVVSMPTSLAFSYLFYRYFEKPFMRRKPLSLETISKPVN